MGVELRNSYRRDTQRGTIWSGIQGCTTIHALEEGLLRVRWVLGGWQRRKATWLHGKKNNRERFEQVQWVGGYVQYGYGGQALPRGDINGTHY